MGEQLEEMRLEALWRLFPIFLVGHRKEWFAWYEEEARGILSLLPHGAVRRISHIGSTAVAGIWAKNIVDILLELGTDADLDECRERLCADGRRCMSQSAGRASLNKGYTEQGFAQRVFHLHLRLSGDNDELYFRDYLKNHGDVAKDYERLKLSLWKEFEYNRDGYTRAKGDFIQRYTEAAKQEYKGRY